MRQIKKLSAMFRILTSRSPKLKKPMASSKSIIQLTRQKQRVNFNHQGSHNRLVGQPNLPLVPCILYLERAWGNLQPVIPWIRIGAG